MKKAALPVARPVVMGISARAIAESDKLPANNPKQSADRLNGSITAKSLISSDGQKVQVF
jgi:hypothetical protein